MTPRVIAVCGKGGVGKTTISALIARHLFLEKKKKALIIDADPAGGLTLALGLAPKSTVNEVRKATIDGIKQGGRDKRDLATGLDYLLFSALAEKGNLAFLAIGRPHEVGCYCSVNTLLREAIELLAGKFDVVVIDAEAGIEQVNRKVMKAVNFLLLVSDSSIKGLRVAETISEVASAVTGQSQAGIVINRIKSDDELTDARAATRLDLIASLPEDDIVRDQDRKGLTFLELPASPAAEALIRGLASKNII